jgi:hypothetical protein
MPVVICPYLFDHEPAEIKRKFSLDSEECRHIRFFFWKDADRIGPERAYEHCWNQFPDDDIIIIHSDMAPMPGEPPNQWFDDLCGYASKMPWAGIIACNLFYPREREHEAPHVQCAGGTFINNTISHLHGRVADDERDPGVPQALLDEVRVVDWVTFGGILIRRQLLRACGSFDLRYEWAYVLDVDYCFEARLRGFVLVHVPVSLQHEESRSTRALAQDSPELLQCIDKNMSLFREKWAPFHEALPSAAQHSNSFLAAELEKLNAGRRPPGLVILAMHRSGSSCLAGMLQASGFHAGNVFHWNEDNRRGNQEDLRIIELNNLVLEASGGSWLSPPGWIEWTRSLESQRDKVLKEFSSSRAPWMFKDPRSVLTLPFWVDAIGRSRLIGVFRNPVSVAQSLAARNGLPLLKGLELWAIYNEALLLEHERNPFPVVCFDLARDEFIASVRQALEKTCGDQIKAGLVDPERLADFFDDSLVYQRVHVDPAEALQAIPGIDADFGSRLAGMYQSLCKIAGIERQPDQASEMEPEMLRNLVTIEQAMRDSDFEAALLACSRILELAPLRADLWMRLVNIAKESGDSARVRAAVAGGLAMLPQDPFLLLEQAKLHWNEKDMAAGFASAEAAASNAPDWIEPPIRLAAWAAARCDWQEVRKRLEPFDGAGKGNRWSKVLLGIALLRLDSGHAGRLMAEAVAEMSGKEREAVERLEKWMQRETCGSSDFGVVERVAAPLAELQRELQYNEPLVQALYVELGHQIAG